MITPPWSDVGDTGESSAFGRYTFMVVDRAGLSNHMNDDFRGRLMDQGPNWNGRFEKLPACSH
jgi:hypothetical protein